MAEVIDLDVLRPEQHLFKLGGEQIDVSYIPTGLAFDIDEIVLEMGKLDQKKVTKGDKAELRKAFDLGVKLCAVFCQWKHPDMTMQWFMENTTAAQVRDLGEAIKEALSHAYEGIDRKNVEATQES